MEYVKRDDGLYYLLDGSLVGDKSWVDRFENMGIEPRGRGEESICSIGWCEKEQKWYGWSHRAIFGFGIGSKVQKGDCAYTADSPEEMIKDRGEFFGDISDEVGKRRMAECAVLPDRSGIIINHEPLMIPMVENLDELADSLGDCAPDLPEEDLHQGGYTIQKCGRGEWVAQTLEDAKQMAIDFAKGVS